MGSLRTPVGPLPSTIYWRRRAVLLLLLALIAALVVWVLNIGSGGGGGGDAQDDNAGGEPAESITPGPSPSESVIDERPGGRETPGEGSTYDGSGGTGDTGDTGDIGDTGEDNGESADPGSSGGAGDTGSAGEAGGTGSAGDAGDAVAGGQSGGWGGGAADDAAAAGLPGCGPGDVRLALRSDENEYPRGEQPVLRLTVENVSGESCRVNFGHQALTLTIADAEDERVWSSSLCPQDPASDPAAVYAGSSVEYAVEWDRRHSRADCDAPRGGRAAAGTYLAEATLEGLPVAQTSFRLDQD